MMNVSSWSIRNPIPAVMLFVLLTLRRLPVLQCDEGAELPGHRPADGQRHRIAAGRGAGAAGNRRGAQDRELDRHAAGPQAHLHQGAGWRRHASPPSSGWKSRCRKRSTTCARRCRACAPTCRPTCATPSSPRWTWRASRCWPSRSHPARMDEEALSWFVDNDISRKLLAVRGVGAVNRVGGVRREIRVALDPARLQALGATAADISRQLRQVQTESAGRPHRHRRQRAAGAHARHRADGRASSPRWSSPLADGRRIRLDQVAAVTDTVAEPRAAALLNGKPVVGFEVARSRGESEVAVGAACTRRWPSCKRAASRRGADRRPSTSSTRCEEEYDGSLHLLYEGAILAVLVVWLFLRDWRATFVVGHRAADVGDPGLHRHVPAGLLDQRRDAAGAVAGGRHPGGRRDRGGGEHRAPPAHGQDAVPGGDGGGRRDRPGGDRHHLHADRRVPAHRLHERRGRASSSSSSAGPRRSRCSPRWWWRAC